MAETKFTPGPWQHDANIPTSFWADGVWLGSTNAESVSSFDERVANARLIAAAPALYEAATEARELLLGGWSTKEGYEFIHADVIAALDILKAALAKAVQP